MTTIHDVAAAAGVSAATVSRVINGRPNVNEGLAEQVRDAITRLDYRPNIVARSMRTQRTGIVAVIVPDVENPFFTAVVRGIEDVARATGQLAVLCNTDDQLEAERRCLRLAVDQRVDGVILASTVADQTMLPWRGNPGAPTVLIDRAVEGLPADTVLVDNRAGAREATAHLIASGVRRPACVTGPAGVFTAEQRVAGYLEALDEAGIPRSRALVRFADYRVGGGRAAVHDLIRSERRRPDGLLVCNNQMTLGALQELDLLGVGVPQDLLLVGYDDEAWSSAWRPSITTIAQPARAVGEAAMRLLLDRLADPHRELHHVVMSAELRVRESTQRMIAA